MIDPNTAPTTETPATTPIGALSDLGAYREARDKGLTEVPNPAAKAAPAAVDDTPDAEVEADPELRKEIDALEAPKADETPQEKAARTRRNKEAARKGYSTRKANEAARALQRAETAERELQELRQRLESPSGGAPPQQANQPAQPAAKAEINDPNDPEPTLADIIAKFPDEADPYAKWQRETAKWDRRQEARAERAEQQKARDAEQAAQIRQQRIAEIDAFDKHSEALRRVHADFDTKVSPLALTGPMATAIFGAGELGPAMAYHLASHPDEHRRIASLPPTAQLIELGHVKATVQQASKPAAPQHVTQAPPPQDPVGAGARTGSTRKASEIDDLAEYRSRRSELMATS